MAETIASLYRPLLEAVAFAARAHRHQLRKDRETPYVSHVFRVCLVLAHVFGVSDRRVLTAAVLHDTLEDTTTDFDDLEEKFDREIAGLVAQLSKDTRLPYEERERAYCEGLTKAPWQVQVCKLADLFDNALDHQYLPLERRRAALPRQRRYLDALKIDLKPEAAQAWELVVSLFDELEAKRSEKTGAEQS